MQNNSTKKFAWGRARREPCRGTGGDREERWAGNTLKTIEESSLPACRSFIFTCPQSQSIQRPITLYWISTPLPRRHSLNPHTPGNKNGIILCNSWVLILLPPHCPRLFRCIVISSLAPATTNPTEKKEEKNNHNYIFKRRILGRISVHGARDFVNVYDVV